MKEATREMAEGNALKESVKGPVKNLVKETISDNIYRIVKTCTKKTVKELKEKLKDKAVHKLEMSLKEVSEQRLEQQLNENIKQVAKEITEDNAERVDFIRGIERGFEKGFNKYLSSLSKGLTPLKPIVITCVSILVVGGVIFTLLNLPPAPSPPPAPAPPPEERPGPVIPRPEAEPDLVIIEVWHRSDPRTGDIVIYYVIQNIGEGEVGTSTTYLYSGDKRLMEDPIGPFPPGQRREEAFPPYPLDPPFEIELHADGDNRIGESNEENNRMGYEYID